MSTGPGPDPGTGAAGEPSEEELRRAYEEELKRLRVEHVLIEHVVAMINVGMLRTGLSPDTEAERDPVQVRLAIESIRALMPVLEQAVPQQVGQIRAALSQLQMAFVKIGGGGAQAGAGPPVGVEAEGGGGAGPGTDPPPAPPAPEPSRPGEQGPAQRSGRLWIPGQ
jgi:hypothetical protein